MGVLEQHNVSLTRGGQLPRSNLAVLRSALGKIPNVTVNAPPDPVLQAISSTPELPEMVAERRNELESKIGGMAVCFCNCTNSRSLAVLPELWNKMYEFQRFGVIQMVERKGRSYLADEMGLGKTIQAIATVKYFNRFPLLIVCPKSLRSNWISEMVQWYESFSWFFFFFFFDCLILGRELISDDGTEVQKITTNKTKLDKSARVVIITCEKKEESFRLTFIVFD